MPFEFKKEFKEFYLPKNKPEKRKTEFGEGKNERRVFNLQSTS